VTPEKGDPFVIKEKQICLHEISDAHVVMHFHPLPCAGKKLLAEQQRFTAMPEEGDVPDAHPVGMGKELVAEPLKC
jgi:hypothetical protein